MKLIKSLTCVLTVAFSHATLADVTISVPDEVSVLAANGEKVDLDGGLLASEKTLMLPDGTNQIVFRYAPFFNQGNDRVRVESDAIITRFTASDTKLTFQLPEYRNLRDAEQNIKSLDWKLMDASGNAITVKQDKLIKPGIQLGRDYVRELEDYNRHGGVAAVTVPGAMTQPNALPADMPHDMKHAQSGTKADSTAEEMLHFWYQKADAETKASFKEYINLQ